jgi:hypothetical protein
MIKQIAEKWRDFWRMTSNVALSMDADPMEDIHRRIRRLEAAVFQSEVGNTFAWEITDIENTDGGTHPH